jgi:hypothetical protein
MHARQLYPRDEMEYGVAMEERLRQSQLEVGAEVIVRMAVAFRPGLFGLEYRGEIVRTAGEIRLRTRSVMDPERKISIPLNLGADDMLYSLAVPQGAERLAEFPGDSPRWMLTHTLGGRYLHHQQMPAFPSRPFGYVLPAPRVSSLAGIVSELSAQHKG